MNPFTHSTVARPLVSVADHTSTSVSSSSSSSSGSGKNGPRRVVARMALGMLAGASGHAPAVAIDVNVATQSQLVSVRGIGPRTAQIIIDERRRAGPFESFEDLSDRVKGIGPSKASRLQDAGLTVGRRYFVVPEPVDAIGQANKLK